MPAGLAAGTTTTSVLVAKFVVSPSRFLPWSSSGYFGLAAAKTSAGTPCSICAASWSEPAKLSLTVQPGWAA